jgi:DNA-binding transcriptional regulator YbjK
VRSAVTGLNDEALSAFAEGEERIVEDYNSAIEDNRDDAAVVGLLERQKEALKDEIRVMRATADGKLG